MACMLAIKTVFVMNAHNNISLYFMVKVRDIQMYEMKRKTTKWWLLAKSTSCSCSYLCV